MRTIKSNPIMTIAFQLIKWILILFFAIYALFPLLWLVISSFKTNAELLDNPFSLPEVWQIQNYINAIEVSGIGRMMINSVAISLIATLLNVLISAMMGYCLSRFSFKGRDSVYMALSAGILIPLNALMIPYFVIINKIGIYDNLLALILIYTSIGLPISTFLIKSFMQSIPKEMEDAATIDGCGFVGIFTKIILPLSKPGLMTAATLNFLNCWNEFVYANLMISSNDNKTLQLGIKYFTNQFTTDYVSMYAAIVISIVPCIIAYVLFQKQIVRGLVTGAVKG